MRTLLILALLLAAPLVLAAPESGRPSTDEETSESDFLDLGPDPPPGRPCRPHCITG